MIDEQFRHAIETIQQRVTALRGTQAAEGWEEIAAAVENLQLIYEEIQAGFEATEAVEESLMQQNQETIDRYHHYYDLFQFSPIAYLVTDLQGVILEANEAISRLLNRPQRDLVRQPFSKFVSQTDQIILRHKLNRLAQIGEVSSWQVSLCPHDREAVEAELHVAIGRNADGQIQSLRIGVYDLSRHLRSVTPLAPSTALPTRESQPTTPLPHALDGLRVLVVDDDMDAREFITVVLEAYGIQVRAVGSALVALEVLEQFHPDVLVSDLRMPDIDGYSLMRRVRALEEQNGRHLPAAAITAYLDEDREKALTAGYEAHWHKLAQPTELIEILAQLVGRR